MEELQLALTVARTDQRNFGIWLRSWQVGHILQALVVDKGPSGDLVLRVGGQQITATADFPVQRGAQLMLQVASLTPAPTLKLLNPAALTSSPATPQQTALNGLIQALLPRQAPVHSPFAALAKLLANDKKLASDDGKTTILETLMHSALKNPEQLGSSSGLKKALGDSGFWSGFSSVSPEQTDGKTSDRDLKSLLLELLKVLASRKTANNQSAEQTVQTDKDYLKLSELVEGALSKITLHQLASIKASQMGEMQWLIEIPLQLGNKIESLQVFISKDRANENTAAQSDSASENDGWQVELNLATEELGELQADIFLRGERVSATFYSTEEGAVERLDRVLPTLEEKLVAAGFEVPALICQQGARQRENNRFSADGILVEKV